MSAVLKYDMQEEVTLIEVHTEIKNTGRGWNGAIEEHNAIVCSKARKTLRDLMGEPTGIPVGTVIGIFHPSCLREQDRTTQGIFTAMRRRGLRRINPVAMCLLAIKLGEDELEERGLWWLVGYHRPIYFKGKPYLLSFGRSDGPKFFNVCDYDQHRPWTPNNGFVCEVP